jgi:GTP-binding protein
MSRTTPPPKPSLPAPEAAAAGWLHTARFLTTAAELSQLPASELPEIAFVGRSNAGKSTAINALVQQKRLAFASRTPGRTQHINLFELGRQRQAEALFADLPGYGYAAVPKEAKARWQRVMAHYLEVRRNLVGLVLLCDPRHGLTEHDHALLGWVKSRLDSGTVRLAAVLTKADKLNRREKDLALAEAKQALAGHALAHPAHVQVFSAVSREGLDRLSSQLYSWCHDSAQPVGTPALIDPQA